MCIFIQYASRITAALLCSAVWLGICCGSLVWHFMLALCARILHDRVAHFCIDFGSNLGGLVPSWGPFEGSWAHLGSKLGAPGAMLVPRGGLWGHVGRKAEVLGAMLAPTWAKLGPSWGVLGPSCLQVGSSGGHVGSKMRVLGAMLAPRGSSGGHVGSLFGVFKGCSNLYRFFNRFCIDFSCFFDPSEPQFYCFRLGESKNDFFQRFL